MGLTHVALPVTDPDASVAFYERYAAMKVVHRRRDEAAATTVVWLSDLTRPFVIVLVEAKRVYWEEFYFTSEGRGKREEGRE